jgi:hypothetical protein
MEKKIVQNFGNEINENEQGNRKDNYTLYENAYYYQKNQSNKNVVENPKVIQNKIITKNNDAYSTYQQNKQIIKNNNQINNSFMAQNGDLLINRQIQAQNLQIDYSNYQENKKQLNQNISINTQNNPQRFQISSNCQNYIQQAFDLSIPSQKPSSYEMSINNINEYNNNINKRISNIVNIDNQSSAIELCFIAKKQMKNYKISSMCQVGANQKPIILSFIAEKPNKNNNISTTNESSIQNASFISSKQIEPNDMNYFSKQDQNSSMTKSSNNLKIMTHGKNKDNANINSKPKPVLQIVSKDKNNYTKRLNQNLLSQSQISEFSLDNDKNNEIIKNNYIFISKSINDIPNNNNNQDLSFISNLKETENLLEIKGINMNDYKININNSENIFPSKDKQIFLNNGLSSSQQSANNNRNNIYSNYIMINYQFYYLSTKQKLEDDKYKIDINCGLNNYNCSFPKKRINIEYYDIQPVSFQCIGKINEEKQNINNIVEKNEFKSNEIEHVNIIHFYPYKMFRIVEIEYLINRNSINNEEEKGEKKGEIFEKNVEVQKEDGQENEQEQEQEQKSVDKSDIIYNDNGKKKRKKRKKK